MSKSSYFGHLINIQHLQFSGTIINSLLLREVHSHDFSMWFKVGNKVYIFYMEEFALATGLNCKPLYKPNIDNVDGNDCARLYKELMDGLERCTTFKLE